LKKILSLLLAHFLIIFGFVRRARKKAFNGNYILSIYFHSPEKEYFTSCIRWFKKHNFQFISPYDVEAVLRGERKFPKVAVLVTVDDGWESNESNIIEVANENNIPVTFFISTEPVETGTFWWSYIISFNDMKLAAMNGKSTSLISLESMKKISNNQRMQHLNEVKSKITLDREAMTVEGVKRISLYSSVIIGCHTVSHPILINCSDKDAYMEISESKKHLEQWINKKVTFFAYPNGDYGDREIKILKEVGFSLAFSTEQVVLTPQRIQLRYQLPRFDVTENAPWPIRLCRMVGVWQPILKKIIAVRNIFSKNIRLWLMTMNFFYCSMDLHLELL
jgi:peptidoglycan/xylan/chitin deacetylase (PgdA/CDA1 family)